MYSVYSDIYVTLGKKSEELKQYSKMIMYYNEGIKSNNPTAMNNLAEFFQYKLRNNYKLMRKLYLNAIKINQNYISMYNLGKYYEEVEQDYKKMKKFYLNSIKFHYDKAFKSLGIHYLLREKNKFYGKYYLNYLIKNNSDASCLNIIGMFLYLFKYFCIYSLNNSFFLS